MLLILGQFSVDYFFNTNTVLFFCIVILISDFIIPLFFFY